jgi:hypothetical protein
LNGLRYKIAVKHFIKICHMAKSIIFQCRQTARSSWLTIRHLIFLIIHYLPFGKWYRDQAADICIVNKT